MNEDTKLRWARRLSIVPRWTIVPTIQKQNVAEHSFQVLAIVDWLLPYHAEADGVNFDIFCKRCRKMAQYHDLLEAGTGDTPTPNKPKKNYATMAKEELLVKVADILEAMLFLHEEQQMGNQRVQAIFDERSIELARVTEQVPMSNRNHLTKPLWDTLLDVVYCSHPGME